MREGFLGVIGGMGPLATVDFLRKLVEEAEAGQDQEHVPVIVWGDCRMPDRTEALLGDGPSPLPHLRDAADNLRRAGARALVIACNTAHAWATNLESAGGAPLIHIGQAAANEVKLLGHQRVAIMSTRGTLRARVYHDPMAAFGIEVIVPGKLEQVRIDRGIRAVKAGDVSRGRADLEAAYHGLSAAGADAVILACTEIPVALDPLPPRAIDATRALARAANRWWAEAVDVRHAAPVAL